MKKITDSKFKMSIKLEVYDEKFSAIYFGSMPELINILQKDYNLNNVYQVIILPIVEAENESD